MSAIDQYKHECIGKVKCPSCFNIVYASDTKEIPVYRLKEDIPGNEIDFDGKSGDILVGGGSGEAAALRISIPEAIHFYAEENWDNVNKHDEIYKAFWTPTQAYVLCDGFRKLGWEPTTSIEKWITEHVLSFLRMNFQDDYLDYLGNLALECDGSMVYLLSEEEKSIFNSRTD